jgi:nitrile hydratase
VNGIHDMGGMNGFGPVERDGAVFHADREKRQCALSMLALKLRLFNVDEDRHSLECLDPAVYLQAGIFERWQARLEELVVARGLINLAELNARTAQYLCGERDDDE